MEWNGEPIPQSPFHVYVCDPTKCIPREPIVCQGKFRFVFIFYLSYFYTIPGTNDVRICRDFCNVLTKISLSFMNSGALKFKNLTAIRRF